MPQGILVGASVCLISVHILVIAATISGQLLVEALLKLV